MIENSFYDFTCFSSPLGWIVISVTLRGICRLDFHGQPQPDHDEIAGNLRKLHAGLQSASEARIPLLKTVRSAVLEFLSHRVPLPMFPLDVQSGTPFQKEVWQALRDIPFGETRSYRDIAEAIGKPKAYRAVGQACGKNPIALIVPCHRVIAHDGTIGGYGGGLHIKKALLAIEKAGFP